MLKTHSVEPYPIAITRRRLREWQGVVRVWDTPQSAIEGAQVVDRITAPTDATVVEEQLDLYGALPQRARIRYGDGKEGWVVYAMVERPAVQPPPEPG